MRSSIVIAGGGLAAQRCCETLRRCGHTGKIAIVCQEGVAPYDRPPLSKDVLAGKTDVGALSFRSADWYAEKQVDLLLGRSAMVLNAGEHRLGLDDGTAIAFDKLLIATGAQPRRLDLFDGYRNVHMLRSATDAQAVRAALTPGSRLVVIGAGFIGQEVAATARGLGAEVTLLEAMDAPLAALLGHELGTWFADFHRRNGIDVHCGVTATDVRASADGRLTAIVGGDDKVHPCDHVVVGVGVVPADGWLAGSGLGGGGVQCDEHGRTELKDVYAAGDVARPYDRYRGAHVRSEHWEAAARQGAAAARSMLGIDPVAAAPASFWSDQYGVRIQHLGYPALADHVATDGDMAAPDFCVTWTRDGAPVAALLVGRPRELPGIRSLIQQTLESERQEMTT